MNDNYLKHKGDERRITYSLEEIKEIISKSTSVVNWYPHSYDGTVRGPFNRWFTASGGDKEHTSDISSDVEYAAASMNSLPFLVEHIEKLQTENERLNRDLNAIREMAKTHAGAMDYLQNLYEKSQNNLRKTIKTLKFYGKRENYTELLDYKGMYYVTVIGRNTGLGEDDGELARKTLREVEGG